ncbi:MAG: UvrD-helicase domain-containing protein, partial [Clostridiales bacterium]|nr:UvrD-helicase domain-containing protein [Clostridiales bacterium]
MSTRFSQEQLAAINSPGNVIVSAGAGSGKTTVMVERVVKKLLAGNKLDKMLIVTFTRASAADIRVKLAERLTRLKRENAHDANVRAIAAEALEALPVCNIGTLHSFCQRLIRSYYYAARSIPRRRLRTTGRRK